MRRAPFSPEEPSGAQNSPRHGSTGSRLRQTRLRVESFGLSHGLSVGQCCGYALAGLVVVVWVEDGAVEAEGAVGVDEVQGRGGSVGRAYGL